MALSSSSHGWSDQYCQPPFIVQEDSAYPLYAVQNSDWRWIDPSVYKGCYWYPSVDATYQESKDWQPVIETSQWLKNHF